MIDLKFRGCDFPDFEMSFQCLGHWTGDDGLKYLSLLDMKLPQLGEEPRPRYRCAIYQTDLNIGVTHVALSNDSTCVNQLENQLRGYETLMLEKRTRQPESLESTQRYPVWSQGNWGKIYIHGSDLTYRSAEELTTYHARALISPASGKFLARISTACGELGYACVALEQRTENIMEMKIGKIDSAVDLGLCSEDNMSKFSWITVANEAVIEPCPLSGSFTGVVPDTEGLCARSSTSCSRPDLMEYQVYNCENTTEVYEDRLYQCYGQFLDGGLVYTLTKRLDIPIQECFVGTTVGPAHYIMEAGAHCQRGKQPSEHGMVMTQEKEPDCDSPMDLAPAVESSTSRPVSPRISLVHSSTEPGDHLSHTNHRSHNHPHHHTKPQIGPYTTLRTSSGGSGRQPPRESGQDSLSLSCLVLPVILFSLFLA